MSRDRILGGPRNNLLLSVAHVVVQGVQTRQRRAGINVGAGGTLIVGRSARRGVGGRVVNQVAARGSLAAALKRVEQAKPMADLVHRDLSQVVAAKAASGHAAELHDAAVSDEALGSRAGALHGEVAVASDAGAALGRVEVIEVQVLVGALAQLPLHCDLVSVVGPGGVDGPVNAPESDGEAGAGQALVKHVHLPSDDVVLCVRRTRPVSFVLVKPSLVLLTDTFPPCGVPSEDIMWM